MRAAGLLCLFASLFLQGCAASGPSPSPVPPAVADALSRLDANSEPQRTVLELAAAEGRDVTYEEYHAAFEDTAQCIDDSGIAAATVDIAGRSGDSPLLSIGAVTSNPDAFDSVYAACASRYSELIDNAFQERQEAVDAADRIDAQYRSVLLQCIRDKGVTVPDDATVNEMLDLELAARPDEMPAKTCGCLTGFSTEVGGYCGR